MLIKLILNIFKIKENFKKLYFKKKFEDEKYFIGIYIYKMVII